MTTYRPILKAKPGELEALFHVRASDFSSLMPILEICPETDASKAIEKVVKNFAKFMPAGITIGLDSSHLPHVVGASVVAEDLARDLAARGVSVQPVVPLNSAGPAISSAAQIALAGTGEAIIRVQLIPLLGLGLDLALLGSVTAQLGLPVGRVHLVLDLGPVDVSDLSPAADESERAIQQASTFGAWASISVASGAFPEAISHLEPGQRHTVPRTDAEIWRELTGIGYKVDFADYAINYPGMPISGRQRGPLPNLRYTFEREWVIWREKRVRPGNESFYDLCKKAVADQAWAGSAFSWGDAEIALKAAEATGAGTATQWRAYGTSHHLRVVLDRLATLGEP